MKFHKNMNVMYSIFALFIASGPGCGPGMKRIARIEKKTHLTARMAYHRIPAVSIAMINNSRIEWTRAYGVRENGSLEPITPNTLFQSGSIGKPIMAVAALQMAEHENFSLDTDVNKLLKTWKIPENSFTRRTPVTIREILSHTAGLTLPGVIGYLYSVPLPDLDQILNGEPPANTPPILVDQVPGTSYKYSSGGFMIIQKLLLDYSAPGKLFPEIIQEQVFNPLGMSSSTFNLTEEDQSQIASGHRGDGSVLPGKWYRYPEMGMGVFWTTPTDMAKFLIEIINGYQGIPGSILTAGMVQNMLTQQIEGQGLGLRIADDGRDRFHFYHRGAVEGFQTFLVGYPERGQGVVIMTNSDAGYPFIEEILKSISIEYRWLRGFYL